MQVCKNTAFGRQCRTGCRSMPRRCSRIALAVSNKLVLKPIGPVELKSGVFEVGRAEPADIVIPVPTISSRHALLRVEDGKISITDLNSTNGTMVNGQELAPMKAIDVVVGGEIVFGDMYLAKFKVVEEISPAAEVAAAS